MAKPSKSDVDKALLKGDPLPAGDYAIDWSRGGAIRDLTAEEKAAAKRDSDELTETVKERTAGDAAPAASEKSG